MVKQGKLFVIVALLKSKQDSCQEFSQIGESLPWVNRHLHWRNVAAIYSHLISLMRGKVQSSNTGLVTRVILHEFRAHSAK
jgi:hypothetical protein